MNKEIWKDIQGYEGLYQVFNLGRVKNLQKFVNNNSSCVLIGYYTKEKILKSFDNTKGYLLVKLYKNNTHCTKKIHRLVAEMFIENKENKPQVNHIDGNKHNNCVENLEWCTNQENQIHACNNNLKAKLKGKKNKLSKKVYQYDLKGNLIKEWNSIAEIQYTLKISNVSSVCCGKRNKAGGYIWKYC